MRIDELEESVENPPDECSSCRGKRFGSYLYGFIAPDENLFGRMDRGEVRLGGCCIESDSPRWFCRVCDADHP